MASAPPVNPATNCPGCGAPIARVADRFCPGCGAQLMRPDLRARHINHGDVRPSLEELAADPGAHARAPMPFDEEPTASMPPIDLPTMRMPAVEGAAHAAAQTAPLAAPPVAGWAPTLAAPPLAGDGQSRGLAAAVAAAVILALLGLAAVVILAVARHDPPAPTISTPAPVIAPASGT